MIKTLTSFVLLVVGIVALGVVIAIVGVGDITKSFLQFSIWGSIPLLFFSFAAYGVGAVKWQYILRAMGVRMNFFDLFKVVLIGNAISYITPVAYIGGEVFRGYVLKERHNVPWQKSLSSIGIDKIAEASVWAGVIFAGVIVYVTQTGISSFSKTIAIGMLSAFFFIGWVIVIYVFSFKKKSLVHPLLIKPFKLRGSRGGKFLTEFENEFFAFFSLENKRRLFATLFLSILKNVFFWLRNIFLIYYLGGVFGYLGGMMALAASYIAYSLPIPAALGAQEAILSFVFSNIGFGAGGGAAFSLLLRAADLIVVTIGVIYLFKWGIGFFAFQIMKRIKVESFNGN